MEKGLDGHLGVRHYVRMKLCAHCNLPLPTKRRNLGRPRTYHKQCKAAARAKREAELLQLGRLAKKGGFQIA